jgi:hypothetical protein
MLPAGLAMYVYTRLLAASMSAGGFLCMRILLPQSSKPTHPHPMRCDAFSLCVARRGLPDVRCACKRASQRLQHASLRTFHTWRWSRRWWRTPTPRGRPHGRNESCFVNVSMYCAMGEWLERWLESTWLRKMVGGFSVGGGTGYIHDPSKL